MVTMWNFLPVILILEAPKYFCICITVTIYGLPTFKDLLLLAT